MKVGIGIARQPGTQPEMQPVALVEDEGSPAPGSLWMRLYRFLASWLISTVVHLSLLIVLAVVSFGVSGKSPISLELDSNAIAPEAVSFDVVISGEPAESLQLEIPDDGAPQRVESPEPELALSDVLAPSSAMPPLDPYQPISGSGIERSLAKLAEEASGEGVNFFGVKGKGNRFVFIVDCSGSMDEYRRWRRAVRELQRSLHNLVEPQQFFVLLYNSNCYTMNNRPPRLVKATEENQKLAIKWLRKHQPIGSTYVAQALENAFLLKPDAIFLLSDGEFDDLRETWQVLAKYNGPQGRRHQSTYSPLTLDVIPIHTISLGGKSGAWTMQEIAEQNEGTFTVIED